MTPQEVETIKTAVAAFATRLISDIENMRELTEDEMEELDWAAFANERKLAMAETRRTETPLFEPSASDDGQYPLPFR